MTLKQYFPLSVSVFVVVTGIARYFSVPILPFAVLVLTGETLLGFELEDHKVPRLLRDLLAAAKPQHR